MEHKTFGGTRQGRAEGSPKVWVGVGKTAGTKTPLTLMQNGEFGVDLPIKNNFLTRFSQKYLIMSE